MSSIEAIRARLEWSGTINENSTHLRNDVRVLLAEVERLTAQRDAVLALHQESMMGAARLGRCAGDGRAYPCATARALGVTE